MSRLYPTLSMQTFAVTGANNTILAIVVNCTSNCGTATSINPLIVGLVAGLAAGIILIAATVVVIIICLYRKKHTGKVMDICMAPGSNPELDTFAVGVPASNGNEKGVSMMGLAGTPTPYDGAFPPTHLPRG